MAFNFTTRARRHAVWLLAAALAAVTGCGGSDSPPQEAATAAPTATIAPPHIKSPANGDVIPATASLGDSRGAKIKVAGSAEPGSKITIGSGCEVANCTATVTVDQAGEFTGSVSANSTEAPHRVTVTVAYDISESLDSDRVVVTLGEERPTHRSRPSSTSTPRPRRTRPRSTATALPSVTVAPPAATAAPQVTAAPRSSGTGSGSVVVIGDSLAQGMQPYLAAALPGWNVSVDARIGRPLSEGMNIFNGSAIRPGTVYAFSLFTNDDPRSTAALDAAVRKSVSRAGCAVWATIVRPPVGGLSYDAANQKLHQLQSTLGNRLQLVDWKAAVASNPGWVPGADGVHASAEGYRNRAALYAQAIQNCS